MRIMRIYFKKMQQKLPFRFSNEYFLFEKSDSSEKFGRETQKATSEKKRTVSQK